MSYSTIHCSIMQQTPAKLVGVAENGSDVPQVTLRSSTSSNRTQSASFRRRSLNISHYNALQNAVSKLARIDDFDLEELGYGFFSDVFKVTHKLTGKVMVLKRNKNTNTKMNILREVQLMNRLSHPNILKFKGVCVHEGQLHALTEFINGGDLDQLVTKKNVILTWKQRLNLALDVSMGMKYLHSMGVFHRDLTAKNCLVRISTDKSGKKKYSSVVADLGLAEKIPTCEENESRLSIVGTPYIMAPEVLKSKPYNEKADVFSFGLMVCQLIALVSSDPEELPRTSDFGLANDLFQKMVNVPQASGSDPETSLPPPKVFLQLAFDCCQLDPKSRPSFNQIVSRLEAMIATRSRKQKQRSSSFRVCDEAKQLYNNEKYYGSLGRRGISGRSTTSSLNDAEPHLPTKPPSTRKSSSSRLSRSFSDISRELLSHAANMVASSVNCSNDDVIEESDSFSNPFSALDHLNGGQMKLTDQPSLALLEMTFDLATSDSLKTSWTSRSNSLRRQKRPRSSYFAEGHPTHVHHSPSSPLHMSSPIHGILPPSVGLARSPRSSTSEEIFANCDDCNYQRSMHRAMILSPRGNNLASWWCTRQRADARTSVHNERQSLASVISVLSRNMHAVRRCISLPDLSRISALFHPAENDSLNYKQFSNGSLHNADSPYRTVRSRTSDELFTLDHAQEPIAEESEADLKQFGLSKSPSLKVTAPTESGSLIPHPRTDERPSKSCPPAKVFFPSDSVDCKPSGSINDPGTLVLDHPLSELSLESSNDKNPPSSNPNDTKQEDVDCRAGHSASFSSSSSSGCSTSGFLMTLQTGELSQQKRHSRTSETTPVTDDLNSSLNNNRSMQQAGAKKALSKRIPPKSTNRDSGYEDTVLEDNSNLTNSNLIGESHHHLTWNIPEEAPPVPPYSYTPQARIGCCGLGARTGLLHKDWNSNDSSLHTEYKWHDAVQ